MFAWCACFIVKDALSLTLTLSRWEREQQADALEA
jgi:hypothetical protein